MVKEKCWQSACNGKELTTFDWVQIYGMVFGPLLFLFLVCIIAIIWIWKRW